MVSSSFSPIDRPFIKPRETGGEIISSLFSSQVGGEPIATDPGDSTQVVNNSIKELWIRVNNNDRTAVITNQEPSKAKKYSVLSLNKFESQLDKLIKLHQEKPSLDFSKTFKDKEKEIETFFLSIFRENNIPEVDRLIVALRKLPETRKFLLSHMDDQTAKEFEQRDNQLFDLSIMKDFEYYKSQSDDVEGIFKAFLQKCSDELQEKCPFSNDDISGRLQIFELAARLLDSEQINDSPYEALLLRHLMEFFGYGSSEKFAMHSSWKFLSDVKIFPHLQSSIERYLCQHTPIKEDEKEVSGELQEYSANEIKPLLNTKKGFCKMPLFQTFDEFEKKILRYEQSNAKAEKKLREIIKCSFEWSKLSGVLGEILGLFVCYRNIGFQKGAPLKALLDVIEDKKPFGHKILIDKKTTEKMVEFFHEGQIIFFNDLDKRIQHISNKIKFAEIFASVLPTLTLTDKFSIKKKNTSEINKEEDDQYKQLQRQELEKLEEEDQLKPREILNPNHYISQNFLNDLYQQSPDELEKYLRGQPPYSENFYKLFPADVISDIINKTKSAVESNMSDDYISDMQEIVFLWRDIDKEIGTEFYEKLEQICHLIKNSENISEPKKIKLHSYILEKLKGRLPGFNLRSGPFSTAKVLIPHLAVYEHTELMKIALKPIAEHALAFSEAQKEELSTILGKALILACGNGYVEIAKLLIDAGADTAIINNEGETLLHLVANREDDEGLEILNLLIDKAKKEDRLQEALNAVDWNEETPLDKANNNKSIFDKLSAYLH